VPALIEGVAVLPISRGPAMPCALLLRPLVRGISRWAMLLSVTLLACKPVLAEPLPKDECTRLQEEETLLEGGGAAANLERGPD